MNIRPEDEPCLCDTGFTCLARHVDEAMRDLCHHCGQPPEADGDHSCPCPHADHDCPNHPEVSK